jgi:hypothetical protein
MIKLDIFAYEGYLAQMRQAGQGRMWHKGQKA